VEAGEHGRFAGRLAAQVIEAFVNKQRRLDNNLREAKKSAPVEVGAIWSAPEPGAPSGSMRASEIRGGHFFINPVSPAPSVALAVVTSSQTAESGR
jgi:penicillin-binding protein 2